MRLCAARGRDLRLSVPNTCQKIEITAAERLGNSLGGVQSPSVLAQRFADPALSELVLARDALGVDAQ